VALLLGPSMSMKVLVPDRAVANILYKLLSGAAMGTMGVAVLAGPGLGCALGVGPHPGHHVRSQEAHGHAQGLKAGLACRGGPRREGRREVSAPARKHRGGGERSRGSVRAGWVRWFAPLALRRCCCGGGEMLLLFAVRS
jgi:hypothetical protein